MLTYSKLIHEVYTLLVTKWKKTRLVMSQEEFNVASNKLTHAYNALSAYEATYSRPQGLNRPPLPKDIFDAEAQALTLISAERERHGMSKLSLNADLSELARNYSDDYIDNTDISNLTNTEYSFFVFTAQVYSGDNAVKQMHDATVKDPKQYSFKMLSSKAKVIGIGISKENRKTALTVIYAG